MFRRNLNHQVPSFLPFSFGFYFLATGLHTSIFYFCCHTLPETVKMGAALDSMQWNSFEVVYDTFGCNLYVVFVCSLAQ